MRFCQLTEELLVLRRKTARRFRSAVFYFLSGTFGEQLSPPLSAVVKFQSQRKWEFFGAGVWEPFSSWSWVGITVEWGSEIVERFLPIAGGKVTMTQVQQKACWKKMFLLHSSAELQLQT